MNIYQKAIKLRKLCENTKMCKDCKYLEKCNKSNILSFEPAWADIKYIAETIVKEKWDVN